MKFYETHYEEYTNAVQRFNLHPELSSITLPKNIADMGNIIIYGPSGTGKYSQALNLIKKYSPLKYDKKITIQTEKQNFSYRISDIHYEVDMSLLGCNSKNLWYEIFFQIVEIVSVKAEKNGIIVCKNFHQIQSELLEVFYSYMQHPVLSFIIITEQLSFIPNTIIQSCFVVGVQRPTFEQYMEVFKTLGESQCGKINSVLSKIPLENIMNIKEIQSFPLIYDTKNIPKDVFNVVCDGIIHEMENKDKMVFTRFRDVLYEILTYNLEISECIWYVLCHFIHLGRLDATSVSEILSKTCVSLKYYNNNYRPIYHLENIFFGIITRLN
jgi:Cdc6-like AAA superfamily ATPase